MPGTPYYNSTLTSRSITGQFFARLQSAYEFSWASRVGMLVGTDQPVSETYRWLGQVPTMREWREEKLAKPLRDQGLTITNQEYEMTVPIPIPLYRRDKTGQVSIRLAEMAQRAGEHWESLLSTLITNGTGSTSGLCYDGQYFFDSDHSEGDSGTQTNLLTNTQVAYLNVGTAAQPTQAEMADAITGVIGYMMTWKDDQGEPMNGSASGFLVMVPYNLYGPARAACYLPTVLTSGGAMQSNILVGGDRFNVSVIMNPRLSTTTVFYVFRTDAMARAFIMQEEKPMTFSALGEGSDHAWKNNEYLFSCDANRAAGYGYWQYAAHCTLS